MILINTRRTIALPTTTVFNTVVALFLVILGSSNLFAQCDSHFESNSGAGNIIGVDLMDTRNFRLLDYRRMFVNGTTPSHDELQGHWRGVNKGVATLVGYKQFVKEIQPCGNCYFGDNIQVEQVSAECLRCLGWQPKFESDGTLERKGRFAVKSPNGRGPFGHGTIFSYRDGGNRKSDPARLLVDKVVKIDDNHLLGRATAKFGLVQIPLAYFMLERVE